MTAGVRRKPRSSALREMRSLSISPVTYASTLPITAIELEDLRHSGHGYANLLYTATIAVELEKVNDADLTFFLVEKPEAHLHPQL